MESNDNNRLEDLLRKMYAEEETDLKGIVDEEWQKFEARHFESAECRTESGLLKLAAVFIGLLMLSGIAYAAYRMVYGGEEDTVAQTTEKRVTERMAETPDEIIIFDNASLDSVLTTVAEHYQKQVVYHSDQIRNLHFHIDWNQAAPLADFITLINNFEGINVREERDAIIAE